MLHFKHLALGASILLAGAFLPVILPSAPYEAFAFEPPENLHGFADLYWGESLREVQGEYKTGFVEYAAGGANYFVEIPEAHGFLGFTGEVTPVAHFAAGKLANLRLTVEGPLAYKKKLTESFGEPEIYNGEKYTSYFWKTADSTILLRAAGASGTLFLFKNN